MRADKKNKDAREFAPVLKLWVEANRPPHVRDFSTGFWRRIVLVPFLVHFEHASKLQDVCPKCGLNAADHKVIDTDIVAKLHAEREGILAWVVEGAVKYYVNGLRIPLDWQQRAEEYREDEDENGQMVDEVFEQADVKSKREELYPAYLLWCSRNGIKLPMKANAFSQMLRERFPHLCGRSASERYFMLKPRTGFGQGPAY